MEKLLRGAANVAWVAAVAIILAATAFAYPVRILGSFRVCGTAAPYARGIHVPGYWYCIFYAADRYNYLYKYDTSGSLLSTVRLPGAVRLGDAGFGPPGFQLYSNFGVLDEGARNVKVYDLAGSFVGTWRAVTSDTVAYARWGYDHKYAYLGTRDGRITVFDQNGSLIRSYATAFNLADLAATESYASMPGNYLLLGPARTGDPIRIYQGPTGSLMGTFSLPGAYNVGASGRQRAYYFCLRRLGSEIWAYHADIGGYMAVAPASLGKVKALFK